MVAWTPVYDIPELEDDVHLTPPPLSVVLAAASSTATAVKPQTTAPVVSPSRSAAVPESAGKIPDRPVGLGGWLIIPCIGMVLGPIGTLVELVLVLAISASAWDTLTTPGTRSYVPGFAAFVAFEALVSVAWLAFTIVVAVFLFGTRRYAVRLMVIFLALQPVVRFIEALAGEAVMPGENEKAWSAVVGGIVVASIWIPYFIDSKRVKNTFVN
jgi:hypothetical protein